MYLTIEELRPKREKFSESLITFIIPTIGRPTLQRTLDSIRANTNSSWKAIVMFDGVEPTITSDDSRIQILRMNKTGTLNYAGRVRNHAITKSNTPWIGFVDDDDVITPNYVEDLISHLKENPDVVIFRMKDKEIVLPPKEATVFKLNQVGISFCLKTDIFIGEQIWFEPSSTEDFQLLNRLRRLGKQIIISPHINYIVRP